MATTITNATCTTIVSESISLNGKSYGNSNTTAISSCNEAYERIMSLPAASAEQDWIPILSATVAPDGAGDVTFSEFEYARFTNLDSEYPIYLRITSRAGVCGTESTAAQYAVRVNPGMSHLLSSVYFTADDDTAIPVTAIITGEWTNTAVTIEAIGKTGVCDLEIFVVTK
jgi:hypothetical protein